MEEMVAKFNSRLRQGQVPFQFPESHIPDWLPKSDNRSISQEFFLALQDGQVRGAYILKHQDFWFRDRVISVGNYGLPLSEGVINRSFNTVVLRDVLYFITFQ